jgi:hypothetical protein
MAIVRGAATGRPGAAVLAGVTVLSAAILAFELVLTRLLAIAHWHHFTPMVISLALLGFGASGTFLSLVHARVRRRFSAFFVGNATGFAAAAPLAVWLVQRIPFNALELVWDARQLAWLSLVYLVLAVPFFLGANAVGLALSHYRAEVGRVYGADLVGAALGSVGLLLALSLLDPQAWTRAILVLGMLAAALAALPGLPPRRRWHAALLPVVGLACSVSLPGSWSALEMSPYKGLSQALAVTGARLTVERSSAISIVHVVENDRVPFRLARGMGLGSRVPPPEQAALFRDGDGATPINRVDANDAPPAYLDQLTSALPYHLVPAARSVLVLGAGAGEPVLQALAHAPRRVDAVELDGAVIDIVRNEYAAYSGRIYEHPAVHLHVADPREYLARATHRYDVIQLALPDASAASAAGVSALDAARTFTVEGVEAALDRLTETGVLAYTAGVRLPPRAELRLFATAVAVLERRGVPDPGARLALIRGWGTATLAVSARDWLPQQLEAVRAFAATRGFDLAHLPGLGPAETNRHNRLERPVYHEAAGALLGDGRARFLERYKFELRPVSDDRPYFFSFLKLGHLPELLELRARGGVALLEVGQLLLLAAIGVAVVASIALILAPLLLHRRRGEVRVLPIRGRGAVLCYFALVGFGFMGLEIALINVFARWLHHPVHTVATVLGALLLFAGLGSLRVRGDPGEAGPHRAIAGIAILSLGLAALPPLLDLAGTGLPRAFRMGATAGVLAPLAFLMGMPFPIGIRRLGRCAEGTVPWAWGINGCASVVGVMLASLVALEAGTRVLLGCASLSYLAALAAWRHLPPNQQDGPTRAEW